MATWADFAGALIVELAVPNTQANQDALLTWFLGEQQLDSPNAAFNPLNVQEGDVGYGLAGTGQTNYGTFAQGVSATARVIRQENMAGIYAALQAGTDANMTADAIVASPWAGGHYGGSLSGVLATVLRDRPRVLTGRIAGEGGPVVVPPPLKRSGCRLPVLGVRL